MAADSTGDEVALVGLQAASAEATPPRGPPFVFLVPPWADGAHSIPSRRERLDAVLQAPVRALALSDCELNDGSSPCDAVAMHHGVHAGLGLGYAELSSVSPSLVYCTISGFGRSGPWASRGGFDLVAQAMSGMMTFTGPEGGSEPTKCGVPLTDIAGGVLAALGVTAALHRRQLTGAGEHVDASLYDTGVMFTFLQSALTLATGKVPVAMGSAHPLYSPYEVYEAGDGWIALGTANEANWRRLAEIIGRPDLVTDRRFCDTPARVTNRAALKEIISSSLKLHPRDEWVERLSGAGIPCGPVLNVAEMLVHPQTRARDMVVDVGNATAGSYRAVGCPLKFEFAGAVKPAPAPLLGEY